MLDTATPPAPAAPGTPYAARLDRLRARLRETGLGGCIVGPSSDLIYLTGIIQPAIDHRIPDAFCIPDIFQWVFIHNYKIG